MKAYLKSLKFVLPVFLFWRIGLLVIGYWSIGILTFKASFPFIDETLISSGFPQWLWHWGNFDGVHYLTIASHGYQGYIGNEQVFFPLFPILIKVLNFLTLNNLASALIVSNFFALLSGVLIHKLWGKWPVLFFYLFPTAFFLGAIYTESLFIFLLLLAFYQNKFFGILAGLTRLTGFFSGIFGAIGVGIYMVYLKITFDNPLMFLFNQGGFHNGRANSLSGLITPPQTVFRYLKILFTADPGNIAYWVSLLEIVAFCFVVIFLAYLTWKRKLPISWVIFGWMSVIIPSVTGTLSSMPRYILPIIPIYIFFGNIKNAKFKTILLVLFTLLQALLTILFLRGYWIS